VRSFRLGLVGQIQAVVGGGQALRLLGCE